MFSSPFFWFLMGVVFVLVAAGARAWATSLGLRMTWWKWLLSAAWYGLLMLTVSMPMTLVGENESSAGMRVLAAMGLVTVILGVGLVRVLVRGRVRSA